MVCMPYFRAAAPAAASTPERIGVLVANLGTPDAPTYFAVQRYLREFLSDRRVIDSSRLIWLPLLYGLVLPFRPLRTARKYRKIWTREGSPLAVYSQRLAGKMDLLLQAACGDGVRVALGMTYGHPSIASAIEALAEQNVRRLLVLPLYPQYCASTIGSVFDVVSRALQRRRWLPETRYVNGYCDDAGYIEALAQRVRRHWEEVGERSHLVLSYHGIPADYVMRGDPYQAQCEATTRLLVARLGLGSEDWSHCYQSRFGAKAWLTPYTDDTLEQLARRGVRKLTLAAPSFAVDCLETLEEVAIEYRDRFLKEGGERFSLVPALNDDDRHAEALAAIVKSRLAGWIQGC
jgi:protoporphyrin/coproporphyrin ferrochelatase